MKRAAVALRSLLARVLGSVGLEGGFIVIGTGVLAYGSSLIAPVGPYLVVGVMCILAGIALAIPGERRP